MKSFLDSGRIWILIIPVFIIMFLLVILLMRTPEKSSGIYLPEPPEGRTISGPVRKQIGIALEEAIEKPTHENIGQLGMIYHSNTFYTEAKECYLNAIQVNPGDWRWYYYLGYLCSELGETENAVTYYKKVTE